MSRTKRLIPTQTQANSTIHASLSGAVIGWDASGKDHPIIWERGLEKGRSILDLQAYLFGAKSILRYNADVTLFTSWRKHTDEY